MFSPFHSRNSWSDEAGALAFLFSTSHGICDYTFLLSRRRMRVFEDHNYLKCQIPLYPGTSCQKRCKERSLVEEMHHLTLECIFSI